MSLSSQGFFIDYEKICSAFSVIANSFNKSSPQIGTGAQPPDQASQADFRLGQLSDAKNAEELDRLQANLDLILECYIAREVSRQFPVLQQLYELVKPDLAKLNQKEGAASNKLLLSQWLYPEQGENSRRSLPHFTIDANMLRQTVRFVVK